MVILIYIEIINLTYFLFSVLYRIEYLITDIMIGNYKGRGNQYIHFFMVLYCKKPTIGKQLSAFWLSLGVAL